MRCWEQGFSLVEEMSKSTRANVFYKGLMRMCRGLGTAIEQDAYFVSQKVVNMTIQTMSRKCQ